MAAAWCLCSSSKAICYVLRGFRGFLRLGSNVELLTDGTSGRTRTATPVKAMDFESIVSTNFTTLAHYAYLLMAQALLPKLERIATKPLNILTLLQFALYQLPVEAQ